MSHVDLRKSRTLVKQEKVAGEAEGETKKIY